MRPVDVPPLERDKFLAQFSGPVLEFMRERVTYPEQYGLDVCTLCRERPMAIFSTFFFHAADSLTLVLGSLCRGCAQMDAQAIALIAASDLDISGGHDATVM